MRTPDTAINATGKNPKQARVIFLRDHASPADIIAEQAQQHARWLERLESLGRMFLFASGGNRRLAEDFLDHAVDGLTDGGVLSTWKYRIVLGVIREGAP